MLVRTGYVLGTWAAALLLALGVIPCAQAAPPAPAAPVSHLQRVNDLVAQNQLDAACAELAAEYELSHDPLLWLRIGRLRLRQQQPAEARAAMSRFLQEAKAPHPALKAEAQRTLHELREVPAALPPPAPPATDGEGSLSLYHDLRLSPLRIVMRRNTRLMKIGAGLLAGGYAPALAVSLGLAGSLDQPNAPGAVANFTLLIPVLGPFISAVAAPAINDRGNGRQLTSSWSLPWALTSGIVQAAGLAALVVGAVPHRVPVLAKQLLIIPYAEINGSGLLASGTF